MLFLMAWVDTPIASRSVKRRGRLRSAQVRGHEVGLHYDVRAMARRGGDDLGSQLVMEADLLSRLTGEPVRSIAMHLPGLYGDDPFAGVTEFVNAYDERFAGDIAYFSDSCGAWRDSAAEAFEKSLEIYRLNDAESDPDVAHPLLGYGLLLMDLADHEAARVLLERRE